ncbi:MAG TPA: hypothetical protein PLU50_04400, partial [Pseudobdellovibrionaceae bacterium]|nr:hypothetical protein [Pseudobdellovibrionaceae bacterium]
DFFSAEQLAFIVAREKLALPSQELIRIDLLKSEDPSAEDNMTNSAVLHFEKFVKAASLEELRSQLKKQDLWFVRWFTSLLSSHPGPAKLDNPVGWWEFFGNDTIKKLILSGTVTIPPYALEKLNLSFDQLEVTEQEIKRLRNFSAWVEISDPIELRSKINFENQWFGKSFRDLRSKYSLSWPIVFDLATLGKLVATGRIEVPTQYVKQLRLNNIDRSRMLIMSANGLSVALPDDSGLNPILLDPSINLYIDHVQNWILHSDLSTIAKALHSPNAQTPIEPKILQALMLDFKGMTANDRPGWWLFLSDPALRKLSQISTIWIPQSVKERF